MIRIEANALNKSVKFTGRTIREPGGGAVWFNWSCSGFTVCFRGSVLRARLVSLPNRMGPPLLPSETLEHPCIGVRDESSGKEGFLARLKLTEPDSWLTLFEGSTGEHTISVVKLSENARGKAGLLALETDGEFLLPVGGKPSLRLEVVGDSISCGYGNESSEPGFRTEEENGERAYGALAAKALGAEYSCIAVSGCSVAAPTWLPLPVEVLGMESIYRYTDRLLEKERGLDAFTPWDFALNPNDAVVINLGTNDANEIKMLGFAREAIEKFRRRYEAFIEDVRALNGPDTLILCTLGPMDYYLYDDIRDTVDSYIRRTGDKRVKCRKFGGIIPFTEGIGADTHPSAATHERMGRELAEMLREYLDVK